MNINCFEDLIKELETGKLLEDICKERRSNVEVFRNMAYEDEDLYLFLNELGTRIVDYVDNYIIVYTGAKYYRIPYIYRNNRFSDDLPKETIICFHPKEKNLT